MRKHLSVSYFFFFNDTATTEIYTLSLHDALPISIESLDQQAEKLGGGYLFEPDEEELLKALLPKHIKVRSEEHTSELQSLAYLVCRLLLEKKNHIPLIVKLVTRSYSDIASAFFIH